MLCAFNDVGAVQVNVTVWLAPALIADRFVEKVPIRFESFDYLQRNGIPCDIRNYDLVYSGHMRPNETLESLFYKFNMKHPEDFQGHSLSVSDVVVIKERGKSTAHYVDSFGFKQVDRFEKSPVRTQESRNTRDFER